MADRRGLCVWLRRSCLGRRRAGCVVLLSGPPRPSGSVLLGACPAALESAAPPPLAFPIKHPAHRLPAGRTAVARLVAARLQGRFVAARPVAQRSRQQNCCCVTTRRRNIWFLWELRRRCGAPSARPLRLGVLGFGGPAAGIRHPGSNAGWDAAAGTGVHSLCAGRAAAAVVADWYGSGSLDYHEGGPRERRSPKGQPAGNARTFSAGAYQNRQTAGPWPVYTAVNERDREGNRLRKAWPRRRKPATRRWWQSRRPEMNETGKETV
jgi:hypothetical protein